MPSQTDIALTRQTTHNIRFKIELLDEHFNVEGQLAADVISASFNIDSSSDIRRTSNIKLFVPNDSFITDEFEISWINKHVAVSIGIQYGTSYIYYALGTLLLSSDAYSYDATTMELTLTLVDLMACGTAARGSQIGTNVRIEYGANAANAISAIVSRYMTYKNSEVCALPDTIPYDIDVDVGAYPIDILKQILGLFPTYEQYYDNLGTYHVDAIPTHINEDCLLDESVLDDLIISEKRSFSFSGVKNTTEIWGRTLSADYVATGCTSENNIYTLTFLTDMATIEANSTYSFTPNIDSLASPRIHIALTDSDQESTLALYDANGNQLSAGELTSGRTYVIKCVLTTVNGVATKMFYLQGQKTIHVIVREVNELPSAQDIADDKGVNACDDIEYVVNPSSPYACDRGNFTLSGGEIKQVMKNGVYSAIYTTDLAIQRGKYENYIKARLNTEVELTTILIPFIDVNKVIQYTSPTTGTVSKYLVKSVNMDLSAFTMTMKLSRFYNYYPW